MAKQHGGLGFRDLEVFNLALLAKQGWQILQDPTALVARILKEKYFPSGSFLSATIGRRPSYAWRSICQARKVLEDGLLWRVGNGESIRIWDDKWLHSSFSHKVHTQLGDWMGMHVSVT
jgi:hypothetical protein